MAALALAKGSLSDGVSLRVTGNLVQPTTHSLHDLQPHDPIFGYQPSSARF